MNIFKQEFKMKTRSILIWSLSIAAFIIFYMAFFPGLSADSQALDSIMESLPKEMLQALGLREGLALSSLIGYFTLTFAMIQLAIAIQSSNYGFAILTEEERELTADFLMSKPVSRNTIYWSKFLASFLSLLISSIVIGIASFIALELFKSAESYSTVNVLKLMLTIPIFQLMFLTLSMLISLLFKKVRSVLSLSMALSIGFYVINSIRGIVGSDVLGYFTPFYYFEPGEILKTGIIDLKLLLITLVIITVSLMASSYIYNSRDINSL
nr:ABC transporter permease subunit [Tissierella sp.]